MLATTQTKRPSMWSLALPVIVVLAVIGAFIPKDRAPAWDAAKIDGFDAFRAACKQQHCTPAGLQYLAESEQYFKTACGTFFLEAGKYASCVYNVSGDLYRNIPEGTSYSKYLLQQGYLTP